MAYPFETGWKKGGKIPPKAKSNKQNKDFNPARFSQGLHIFCDGACEPNPGAGGWGYVVYDNGTEVDAFCGGSTETTNNQMELVGLLNAIEKGKALFGKYGNPVTIWCDSQYCVKGVSAASTASRSRIAPSFRMQRCSTISASSKRASGITRCLPSICP